METHGIKFKDKFGYALGDMGGILSFSLVSSYLTMFYTDVLGISAAGAGVPAVLGAIGYQGTQTVQSQQVLTKMFDAATLVPAVILLLMFILTAFCYKLGKSEVEDLHKQLYGNKND